MSSVFSSCQIPSAVLASQNDEFESECDIYTQRCPRAGEWSSGSSGSRRRSSGSRSAPEEPPPPPPKLSPEVNKAKKYMCCQYDEMFEKITDGLDIDIDKDGYLTRIGLSSKEKNTECIEFEKHTILCPDVESVRGCLRVQEIDDPSTTERESNSFDLVCIEEDRSYLGENESDQLRNLIEDDVFDKSWMSEINKLSNDEKDRFFRQGLRSSDLTCNSKPTIHIDLLEKNTCQKNGFPSLCEIYNLRKLLRTLEREVSNNNILKRELGYIRGIIYTPPSGLEMSEKEFIELQLQKGECEKDLEAADEANRGGIQDEIDEISESIGEIETRIEEKESEFEEINTDIDIDGYDTLADYIYAVLSDSISEGGRTKLMERVLKRQKRDLRKKLILCVYNENEDCLSSDEENALRRSGIVHIGEFKAFAERKFIDQHITRVECENGLESGSSCRGVSPKPRAERLTESELDTAVDNFKTEFKTEFLKLNEYFSKVPYGLACGGENPSRNACEY